VAAVSRLLSLLALELHSCVAERHRLLERQAFVAAEVPRQQVELPGEERRRTS
jgi:hypothetical protein